MLQARLQVRLNWTIEGIGICWLARLMVRLMVRKWRWRSLVLWMDFQVGKG